MTQKTAEKILIAVVEGRRYYAGQLLTQQLKSDAVRLLGYTMEQVEVWVSGAKEVTSYVCTGVRG